MKNNQNKTNKSVGIKTTNQQLEQIALDSCVPTKYQRVTKDQQVTDIINNFDEAKLGALTVSLRDGNYHIIDGLHRSKALKTHGYTHALCIVLTGLTYEQEAEHIRKLREYEALSPDEKITELQRQLKEQRIQTNNAESELMREKELCKNEMYHYNGTIDTLKNQLAIAHTRINELEAKYEPNKHTA